MSKAPAFQFYPGDWLRNSNLRRCSLAARGAWVDVLCLMHDAKEYGVLRWPLSEIAMAVGVPASLLEELAAKEVLKGGDGGCDGYVYRARHAGVEGPPVTLIEPTTNPCWYSSRFVRDEHIRLNRGKSTQFTSDNQPNRKPLPTPTRRDGDREGDGASTAIASASAFALSSSAAPTEKQEHVVADATKKSQKGKHVEWVSAEHMVSTCSGLTEPVAVGYLEFRRSKKAALTELAWKSIVSEVVKTGMAPDAALSYAMNRGWRGFDAKWLTNDRGGVKQSRHDLSGMDYSKGVDKDGNF